MTTRGRLISQPRVGPTPDIDLRHCELRLQATGEEQEKHKPGNDQAKEVVRTASKRKGEAKQKEERIGLR